MIEIPTLLILGAGASAPYGFPLGKDIKDDIINDLERMAREDTGWVVDLNISKELIYAFISRFSSSKSPSIDSFLAYQEDFREIGKLAIASIISKYESLDHLYEPDDDDWYEYLIEHLNYKNTPLKKIGRNISIITFNYDRSLEALLGLTLMSSRMQDNDSEIIKQLKKIQIIHINGRLDPLPWENPSGRPYGIACPSRELSTISENIKFIHETKDSKLIDGANKLITDSERIYFLGLDLRNKENLEIFDLSLLKGKEVLTTAYKLKYGERRQIKSFLNHKTNYKINLVISNGEMKSKESIQENKPFDELKNNINNNLLKRVISFFLTDGLNNRK